MNIHAVNPSGEVNISFTQEELEQLKEQLAQAISCADGPVRLELAKLTLWVFKDNNMVRPMWYTSELYSALYNLMPKEV
jgi:hypothetical protein